jgi:heme exporter protein A
MALSVTATGLAKTFNGHRIFAEVSFSVKPREALLITGRNGSGKSTLMKIIAGVLSPTNGSLSFDGVHGVPALLNSVGFVAPYLTLYEEFSARENLALSLALRGLRKDPVRAEELLRRVGLPLKREDPVRTYSSGMKQRVKYACALIHSPGVLMLDEPMSNLDAEGIAMVRDVMSDQRKENILIVATNDLTDIKYADQRVNLHELN